MRIRFLANVVSIVVGFLNVSIIHLRSLLLAAALFFECNLVCVTGFDAASKLDNII